MARRRSSSSGDKPPKRKKVTVKLLDREHAGKITGPYRIMERLIKKHHPHLKDAKVAIAWRLGWNANADGQVKLGQCKKGSDLDRELHGHDFVILLNDDRWPLLKPAQQEALIDHELSHAAVSVDANGKPKFDERGRQCYRTRKHDIEEFAAVVERHGCYKGDVEAFAAVLAERRDKPLLAGAEGVEAERATPTDQAAATPASAGDGADQPAPPDFRSITLAEAGINGKVGKVFVEAGINTLGELVDLQQEQGEWWPRQVKGLGPAGREYTENCLIDFWGKHPELCETAGVGTT